MHPIAFLTPFMHNIAMQEMKPVFRRALEKMHIIKRKQEPAPSEKPKLPEEAQKKLNDELISAAKQDNNEEIGRLIKKGASIEAKDNDGWTVLIYAAAHGRLSTCAFLLGKGANLEAKDNDGKTALMEAARWGNKRTAAFLRSMEWLAGITGNAFMKPFGECVAG
jgi:ankyrin repeat protein